MLMIAGGDAHTFPFLSCLSVSSERDSARINGDIKEKEWVDWSYDRMTNIYARFPKENIKSEWHRWL